MTITVDLNADMGESFGPWRMGDDAALLQVISSANVACGFHAGDPDHMIATMRAASEAGVAVGAHPGFADLQGFGRRRVRMEAESLANLVRYQVAAAQGMARAAGTRLAHVKLHGALSNMASEDGEMARRAFAAVLDIDPDLTLTVLAETPMAKAAADLGANGAVEVFADRAYNGDATLVDRGTEGAVIHDPDTAATRVVQMVRDGAVPTIDGGRIQTRIDTICLHGDTQGAVAIAKAVRAALEEEGITIAPPG